MKFGAEAIDTSDQAVVERYIKDVRDLFAQVVAIVAGMPASATRDQLQAALDNLLEPLSLWSEGVTKTNLDAWQAEGELHIANLTRLGKDAQAGKAPSSDSMVMWGVLLGVGALVWWTSKK